ncbi:MAG: branched-chain amino acid ABC transporter permease [Actinomycetota bacterium]
MRSRARAGRAVTTVLLGAAFVYACSLATSDDIPQLQLVAQALYFAVAAAGLNLLTGYNGQVSIGHGAFFGIGAFTSAILVKDHGWEYLPTLPVAAVLAAVIGVLVGFPALRVKGLYLALVTLGLAVIFPDVIKRFFDASGQGQVTVRSRLLRAPEWWPAGIGDRYQWAYVVTLVVTVAAFVLSA